MPQRSVAPGLFQISDGRLRLIGGRRLSDGKITFPMPTGGEAAHFTPVELAPLGTLWSYTIQRFRPKSPPYAGADDEESFKPYALGYIELPGEVIVESRIETDDFADLKIGVRMALTSIAFGADPNGTAVLTYAFRPVA